jgi:hypothetical protein
VQVPYDEGAAIRIGPESRAVAREDLGEALTGGRIGQPLSRESFLFWVPTLCKWWKATHPGASARAPGRPGVVRDPGMCAPCAGAGRRGAVADDARAWEVGLRHSVRWAAQIRRVVRPALR